MNGVFEVLTKSYELSNFYKLKNIYKSKNDIIFAIIYILIFVFVFLLLDESNNIKNFNFLISLIFTIFFCIFYFVYLRYADYIHTLKEFKSLSKIEKDFIIGFNLSSYYDMYSLKKNLKTKLKDLEFITDNTFIKYIQFLENKEKLSKNEEIFLTEYKINLININKIKILQK